MSDSRSSIQHLSEWWKHGDRTTTNIVQILNSLNANVKIFFQWVPSYVNVCWNEIADGQSREISRKHMLAALIFQKLLAGSSKISVPLGGKPPYMSSMMETVLVLL
ncbi:uncharacterized protein TNCV_2063641 [Trichonephila clavipes]|nr:uncharacterized protein TNCV_2063641 [Trichonephila clavipes]